MGILDPFASAQQDSAVEQEGNENERRIRQNAIRLETLAEHKKTRSDQREISKASRRRGVRVGQEARVTLLGIRCRDIRELKKATHHHTPASCCLAGSPAPLRVARSPVTFLKQLSVAASPLRCRTGFCWGAEALEGIQPVHRVGLCPQAQTCTQLRVPLRGSSDRGLFSSVLQPQVLSRSRGTGSVSAHLARLVVQRSQIDTGSGWGPTGSTSRGLSTPTAATFHKAVTVCRCVTISSPWPRRQCRVFVWEIVGLLLPDGHCNPRNSRFHPWHCQENCCQRATKDLLHTLPSHLAKCICSTRNTHKCLRVFTVCPDKVLQKCWLQTRQHGNFQNTERLVTHRKTQDFILGAVEQCCSENGPTRRIRVRTWKVVSIRVSCQRAETLCENERGHPAC